MRILFTLITLNFLIAGCTHSQYADFIHTSPPAQIDPEARYLFFMHGKIVERKGLPARSKRYGYYDYPGLLDTFASHGFRVISETRQRGTGISVYARRVADQVEALIDAGVPASHITVSGFSKGGRMTLVVSSLLNREDINYVVLAGCRPADIYDFDLAPSGKLLSIYDSGDDTFGSCSEIFAAGKTNLTANEIVLNTGDGHGVFYTPVADWVAPMMAWAGK